MGHLRHLRAAALGLAVCVPLLAAGCSSPSEEPPRILVVGIDGADWDVIRGLWGQSRLPHLKDLADRGVTAILRTDYGNSAAIWTTIATGVRAERHGIVNFHVPTPDGNKPATSTLRRVPALWNMLSAAGRRVAVLFWWVTWPAERVNGVLVSDRAFLDLEESVWPPERADWLRGLGETGAGAREKPLGKVALRDQLSERAALELLGEDFQLVMAYFRRVDVASHNYWKYFRPRPEQEVPEDEIEALGDRVPRAYERVDAAIGRLVEAAGPETTVVVVSDHGFYGLKEEKIRRSVDFDALLAELGFLERSAEGVDLARSRLYTFAGSGFQQNKPVRFALAGREPGGTVKPEEREAIRRELEEALAGITNEEGDPVFWVRDRRREGSEARADFVVRVRSTALVSGVLQRRGQRLEGILGRLSRISGSHGSRTHGIFLAAGPRVDPAADLRGVRIFDVAPTLLYGLGLPVAEDFDGRARTELFTAEFRRRHPLRTIASWGPAAPGEARESAADEALTDELRALGYLD